MVFKSMKVRWAGRRRLGRWRFCQRPCPCRQLQGVLLLAVWALAGAAPAAWAQAAPVLAGSWDVRTLLTHVPLGTAPQARRYRICIGPDRTPSPMLPRSMAPATELVFDARGYNGYAAKVTVADGSQRQLEFSYRRLSARAFEGTHDLSGPNRATRLQYDAQYAGPDCGATQPSWPRDSGEP